MGENLLNIPEGFDAEDERLLQCNFETCALSRNGNDATASSHRWYRMIARFLFSFGVDAFETRLMKLKEKSTWRQVRSRGMEGEVWLLRQ